MTAQGAVVKSLKARPSHDRDAAMVTVLSHLQLLAQDAKADKAQIDAAVDGLKKLKIELEALVKARF